MDLVYLNFSAYFLGVISYVCVCVYVLEQMSFL